MNSKFLKQALCLVALLCAAYSSNSYSMDDNYNNNISSNNKYNQDSLNEMIISMNNIMNSKKEIVTQSHNNDNLSENEDLEQFEKCVNDMTSGDYSDSNIQQFIDELGKTVNIDSTMEVLQEASRKITYYINGANKIYKDVETVAKKKLPTVMKNAINEVNDTYDKIQDINKSIDSFYDRIAELTQKRDEMYERVSAINEVVEHYNTVKNTYQETINSYRGKRHTLVKQLEHIKIIVSKKLQIAQEINNQSKQISGTVSTMGDKEMSFNNNDNKSIVTSNNKNQIIPIKEEEHNNDKNDSDDNFVEQQSNSFLDNNNEYNNNKFNNINNNNKSINNNKDNNQYINISKVEVEKENNKNNTVNSDNESKIDI